MTYAVIDMGSLALLAECATITEARATADARRREGGRAYVLRQHPRRQEIVYQTWDDEGGGERSADDDATGRPEGGL